MERRLNTSAFISIVVFELFQEEPFKQHKSCPQKQNIDQSQMQMRMIIDIVNILI